VSSPPVFLADPLPAGGQHRLTGAAGRHAATVRRLRPGERVDLTDGSGGRACCTVSAVDRGSVTLAVTAVTREPAPAVRFTLVQALAKGEYGELAVQLATEIGVDTILAWQAARSVPRPSAAAAGAPAPPPRRWPAVAAAAAAQARRVWWPEVTGVYDTAAVAARLRAATAALVLHESAPAPLSGVTVPVTGEIVVVVGPEGGLTAEELAALTAAGGQPVRLGPAVLRTATAGAAALAALAGPAGRW